MTRRKYIKPPRSQDCVWRSGPPPEIGWWPADCYDEQRGPSPSVLRWWDGEWSCVALDGDSAERAGRIASLKSITPERFIRWTDRWWEEESGEQSTSSFENFMEIPDGGR